MSEKSHSELDQELAHALAGERAHTLPTILLIADIERGETFVEAGFSTIWDYLRRVHRQSDTMIHYRVTCARAVNRFPQVIEFLRDGRLCMTTLAELMKIMNESNCDALLAEALGKSKRDAEKIVAREKPKAVPKDVTRTVAPTFPGKWTPELPASAPAAQQPVQTEVLTESLARKHMTIDREYEELLKAAHAALSHKMPGAAELDIIKEGFRAIIKQDEKRKGSSTSPARTRSPPTVTSRNRFSASYGSATKVNASGRRKMVESAVPPIAFNSITNKTAERAGSALRKT